MRKSIITLLLVAFSLPVWAQSNLIREMRWGRDYKLHVRLANDSSYVMDIQGLYHQGRMGGGVADEGATFFPVALDQDFVDMVKSKPLRDTLRAEDEGPDSLAEANRYNTLWSALHREIGGGYVHLINCIIYALEGRHLNLQSPAMRRPASSWKPDPMTESYRRTRKWSYYVPVDQKIAQREYKLRRREGDLGDLQGIPSSFIDLFNSTSNREYRVMVRKNQQKHLAQIDLVKMMLGAKYLGRAQIRYVSECVRKAILHYTASNLPSVIILDDFQAAVAMRLDANGYRVDYIVFENQSQIPREEVKRRERAIRSLVDNINEANYQLFQHRLSSYYK